MNPYKAYQSQRELGMSRIDTLLALYDETVTALERASAALRTNNPTAAAPALDRARLAVSGLAAGIAPGSGEVADNLLRLYEFVLHRLETGTAEDVTVALEVLQPVREGLQAIRPEALALERGGSVPPITTAPQFQAQA